ncbi:winged helix DNA-binding protein [Salibacteraceae bacterium]|jgi:MarR family transcriptional regulator, organic hydroperoxide resistance regulator|nr:winged helix DNA-binding protein [Salibacteraceae bacterium]MDC1202439.1 winged helix DNA-binding protein [Salibacteraceae bacterium]HAW19519.1 MarR family transcriptional regulator [Flavobacteriales bacterium]
MKSDETIDFHIRWAWLKIAKMYNQEAVKHGLTQSTGFVLLSIDPVKGTPSTQLGPMMGMEPTSLSRTLKSMEERSWIKRKSDATDGRVTTVHLTEEGKRLREISKSTVIGFNKKVLAEVDKASFENFIHVIEVIEKHTSKN